MDLVARDNRQKVSKISFSDVILLAFGCGGTGEELNLRPQRFPCGIVVL